MNNPENKTGSIFITGNSRSGTTMLSKILGRSPLVFSFHELHFFEQLWYPEDNIPPLSKEHGIVMFSNLISLQREGFLAVRNPRQFHAEASEFFESNEINSITPPAIFMNYLLYESTLNNKIIPCEQTPRNLFFIDEIIRFYPNSKIICMIRDPRDVLLSQKYKWKRRFLGHDDMPVKEVIRSWFNYHPITISKLWNSSAKKISGSMRMQNVHLIQFEELIANPESVVKKLCSFLNIGFDDSMLMIPTEGSSNVSDVPGQLGIDKTKTGNFSKGLTPTEIYLCQETTAVFRRRFGYQDVKTRLNVFKWLTAWTTFPVKIFFALLLNIQRSKNLFSSIKRRFA